MRTSQLDQIVRQKDPELLRAVEHLSRNETSTGVQLLQQQGRIIEIPDRQQRIEAIAKDYVARPENTLIVSPDNASRHDINDAVRAELQNSGALSKEDHPMTVLTQRSELTSADRNWAALYQPADVLYYTRGSKELGIERGSYAIYSYRCRHRQRRGLPQGARFTAWLGLVPRRIRPAAKAKLLGISKRGNIYLRKILIHGARAAAMRIKRDRFSIGAWMNALEARAPRNVLVVATANKLARIAWAVLSTGENYRPGVIATNA